MLLQLTVLVSRVFSFSDVIREEEEREKAILEEQERKEKEAEALEFFHKFDTNQDGRLSKEEIIAIHVFDQNNDGMVSDEEADFYLSGNENYDQEGFLNTGWLLMKHLLSKYEKKKGQKQEQDIPEAGEGEGYIMNQKIKISKTRVA